MTAAIRNPHPAPSVSPPQPCRPNPKSKNFGLRWLVLFAIAATAAIALTPTPPAPADEGSERRSAGMARPDIRPSDRNKSRRSRLREGTRITDHMGRFVPTGDGAMFLDESGISFGCLPNLNLERVVRLLRTFDVPEDVRWSVSGLVTEYSGRNHLLVSKAIYKANAATRNPLKSNTTPQDP